MTRLQEESIMVIKILWIVIICIWMVDIALTNQYRKRHNVTKFSDLANTKSRPKDFVLDILNIGFGIVLIYLGGGWISRVLACGLLIVSIKALRFDIDRWTDPTNKP